MNECIEDGPNRRTARSRRRSTAKTIEDASRVKESRLKLVKGNSKNNSDKNADWFSNSFNSRRDNSDLKNSRSKGDSEVSVSAAVHKNENVDHQEGDKNDVLDTSDAMLADIDIENLQPELLTNKNVKSGSSGEEIIINGNRITVTPMSKKSKDRKGSDLKGSDYSIVTKSDKVVRSDLNSTTITQSQYFASKFKNYKPTQLEEDGNISQNVSQQSETCDGSGADKSVFSFSFVGNDTVYDNEDDSIVPGSPVKPTQRSISVRNILNSTKLNDSRICVSSAKVSPEQVSVVSNRQTRGSSSSSDDNNGIKYQCTPYLHDNVSDTQASISQMTQSLVPSEADITQLKDRSINVKYRCTPYKQQMSDNLTQTGTQTQCSVLEISSVISQPSATGRKKSGDLTYSQGKYLTCTTQHGDLNPTPFCDMTGVIVDSQVEAKDQDDPNCDIFEDSFHDDPNLLTQIDKIEESASQKLNSKEKVSDITSNTQALIVESSKGNNKRTLDDDIDEIFNASQKRRNLGNKRKSKPGSNNTNISLVQAKQELRTSDTNLSKMTETNVQSNRLESMEGSAVVFNPVSKGDKSGLTATKGDKSIGLIPQPVTPTTGSLQDRIKQRLKNNAGQKTPQGPASIVDQLREQVLERAQLEVEMVKESVRNDIGPFYGLPSKVKDLLAQYRGITSLYDWQDECLRLPAVQSRKNLIYSLPTSGGKTLVAEILILQELLCQKRDALLILPFVSIVQEKVRNMSQLAVDLNFHVEEYAGSKGRFPPTKRRNSRSLFVATIEKAHSIVNSLLEEDRLEGLGLVVVDELHMIGEGGSRGATMESTLIKLIHASNQKVKEPTHIIGMSATLNNIEDLQKFLNAEIYSNDFRPVKLTENIKVSESIYRIDTAAKTVEDRFIHERIVCFQYSQDMERTDPNHLLGLALEVIPDNSCLIFCPTKKNCESVALMICKMLVKLKSDLSSVKRNERKLLLKELYNDSDGKICPVLQYTLHFGVAYHHSGLTMDERKLIEEAYAGGILCLLTCTSTLAAGVNLPAKRVILKSPYVGKTFISRSQYKQMVGRAGRAGIDTTGESILICQQSDREKVCDLLDRPLEKCHSSLLYNGGKGIRNFLLSSIGLKIVTTTKDVFTIMSRSLMYLQQKTLDINVNTLVQESLQKLIDVGLVKQIKSQSEDPQCNGAKHSLEVTELGKATFKDVNTLVRVSLQKFIDVGLVKQIKSQSEDPQCNGAKHSLEVTEMGKATFKGPVDPDFACMLYEDLKKDECLVISTHLHLLYLVTPYDLVDDITPSWTIYHNQMSTLSPAELKVASIIGVPESYITMRAAVQRPRKMSTLSPAELKVASIIGVPESYITMRAAVQRPRKKVNEFVIKRFYLTLMLYELWCQKTVWEVAEKFQLHRGYIQNLLSSAASFASCVSHFCQEMTEFWAYQDLMGNFVKRLSYCVTQELIPLMEIPGVKMGRARLMYNAGYRTLSSVATCKTEELVKNVQYMPRKVANQIIASAKLLLTEKAEAMIEEVEQLVSIPANIARDNTVINIPTPLPVTPGHSQTSQTDNFEIHGDGTVGSA